MAERAEGFDEAWARIVDELSSGRVAHPSHEQQPPDGTTPPDAMAAGIGSDTAADDTGPQPSSDPGPSAEGAGDRAAPAPPGNEGGSEPGLAALFEPLRRAEPAPPREPAGQQDPGAFVDNWADEGHYTPPPPPELPEGTPVKRLGWTGMIGGPSAMALFVFTGWDAPPVAWLAAGLATLVGFVVLVWHMPDSREDGWDDGAQV